MTERFRAEGRENPTASAEVLKEVAEKTVEEILAVDKAIFPEMPYEELGEILKGKGVHAVLRDKAQKVVGYIASHAHDEAITNLLKEDPALTENPKALYLDSIGVLPEFRSFPNFKQLISAFRDEAVKEGYDTVTAHTRASEGLSDMLQKRYHAQKLRTIEDWAGYGEPFDYLEIPLTGSILSKA